MVEERLGFVLAVRQAGHDGAALRLGLVEDRLHAGRDGLAAVAAVQLLQAPLGQPAGGELRAQVAHRGVGEADVVADQLEDLVVQHAALVQLDLVELEALHPGVGYQPGAAEAGAHASDVHPVGAHHGEAQ